MSKTLKVSGLLQSGKLPAADPKIVGRMPSMTKDTDAQKAHAYDDQGTVFYEIPVDKIDVSPFQPRISFDMTELQALADSIDAGTLVEPITVRKKDERYELVSGERRYRAHQLLSYKTIPAIVKSLDDKESALLSLVSNTARENLSDFELGSSFKKILDKKYATNVVELARYVGISRQQIDRCLDFNKLPSVVINKLESSPRLFGANCAEIFAGYCSKGFEKDVVTATEMIESGSTEKNAIAWLQSQIRPASKRKNPRKTIKLYSSQEHVGDAYIDKNKIVIQCNTGTKPSKILEELQRIFQ